MVICGSLTIPHLFYKSIKNFSFFKFGYWRKNTKPFKIRIGKKDDNDFRSNYLGEKQFIKKKTQIEYNGLTSHYRITSNINIIYIIELH